MAGDWIKMRTDLARDPRVAVVARLCNVSVMHAIGALHLVWSCASETTREGVFLAVVTETDLDATGQTPGLAAGMKAVGWLVQLDDGRLMLPEFERWIGSAKERAQARAKKQRQRSCPPSVPGTKGGQSRGHGGDKGGTASPREEKRREEQETPPPPPQHVHRGDAGASAVVAEAAAEASTLAGDAATLRLVSTSHPVSTAPEHENAPEPIHGQNAGCRWNPKDSESVLRKAQVLPGNARELAHQHNPRVCEHAVRMVAKEPPEHRAGLIVTRLRSGDAATDLRDQDARRAAGLWRSLSLDAKRECASAFGIGPGPPDEYAARFEAATQSPAWASHVCGWVWEQGRRGKQQASA